MPHTSNDWAYQSLTLFIEGIALRFCGSSSSSFTRWAKRTGSSSVEKSATGVVSRIKWTFEDIWTHRARTDSHARGSLDWDSARTEPSVAARLRSIQYRQSQIQALQPLVIRRRTSCLLERGKVADFVPQPRGYFEGHDSGSLKDWEGWCD
jgi:hypothetical protein